MLRCLAQITLLSALSFVVRPTAACAQRLSPHGTDWWSVSSVRTECEATHGYWIDDATQVRSRSDSTIPPIRSLISIAPTAAEAVVPVEQRGNIVTVECFRPSRHGSVPTDDLYFAVGDVIVMRRSETYVTNLPSDGRLQRALLAGIAEQYGRDYGVSVEYEGPGHTWTGAIPGAGTLTVQNGMQDVRIEVSRPLPTPHAPRPARRAPRHTTP